MAANPHPSPPAEAAHQFPSPACPALRNFCSFLTAWLICLMPFLFWWNTWFGRKLSDQQLNEYLHDAKKPRHIQQALGAGRRAHYASRSIRRALVSRLGATIRPIRWKKSETPTPG
jgi:hypothetical protein